MTFLKKWSAVALLSLPLAACSGASGVVTTADAKPGSSASEPAAASKAPAKHAALGDAIKIKGSEAGSEITVTMVKVAVSAKPSDEFSTPGAGNRFAAVQFVIKNSGTIAYEDAPINGAKVIDAEGQQFDAALFASKAGVALPATVKLAPGSSAKGFLTFEVPKKAKLVGAQFSTDSGFGQTAEWKIA